MKDIKQYFANDKSIVDKEAATDSSNVVEQEREQEETVATGKRRRVKIRITRNGSASRMCDIVENKSDLIDKTPSPFNGEINNGYQTPQDETPKSSFTKSGVKRRLEKVSILLRVTIDISLSISIYSWIFIFKRSKSTAKMDGNLSEEMRNISHEKGLNEECVDIDSSPNNNVINFNDETESNIEFYNQVGSQREESNAFQVLMNRSKPIQYKLPPQQSIEDSESKEKSEKELKELKSKCKEKLIALADKKGYSKRKMAEMEEGERIEKNIENRIRFFKGESKSNIIHKSNSFELKNTKQSGNLLNYFR